MKVDEKFCVAFNTLRSENQDKKFSRREIQSLLIENVPGFSRQDYMISILAGKNIIQKVGKGRHSQYMFTKNPIHVASLSEAIFGMKEYNSIQNHKKRKPEVLQNPNNNLVLVNEDYCIKYLKERGYKVMKKIVNYEEV